MMTVRFSEAARDDIRTLLLQSQLHFGEDARRRYETLLSVALSDISEDPLRTGSVSRAEIGPGVRSFHLRRSRVRAGRQNGLVHQPRHFILYRQVQPSLIGVGRVLHEMMDVERHHPASYGDEGG